MKGDLRRAVRAAITGRPRTAAEVAAALGIDEQTARVELWRLEHADPSVGHRTVNIYGIGLARVCAHRGCTTRLRSDKGTDYCDLHLPDAARAHWVRLSEAERLAILDELPPCDRLAATGQLGIEDGLQLEIEEVAR